MNQTERRIARHLQHLAGDAPDVDLVSAARAGAPLRRSWTTPALVAAAVVVLVVVGALVVPRGGGADDPVGSTSTSTPSPTAAVGQRLVGRGPLVVSVPSGWPVVGQSCATPLPQENRVVVVGEAVRSCLPASIPGFVDVRIEPYVVQPLHRSPVRDRRVVAGIPVEVRETPLTDHAGEVRLTLEVLAPEITFAITGPADRAKAVAATLRPVPDGYAVVPDTSFGSDQGDSRSTYREAVRARFEAAGFDVVVRRDGDGGPVSDRPAGTLARTGTTITLTFE